MEKILLKRIGLFLSILFLVIAVVFSKLLFVKEKKLAFFEIEDMIEQGVISYNKSRLDTEVASKFFKEDYLNRAYAVDFMLNTKSEENYNNAALKKIKQLMEVESIHVIDNNGNIVLSSEKESIGLNLKEHEESKAFVQLIDSNDDNANVIQFDAFSITDQESKIYIGVKSSSEKYSVVQICLDANVYEEFVENHSISFILSQMPTITEEALFVIDRDSGKVEGITRNNEQELKLDYANTKEEYLSILDSCSDGKLIKINGSMKFIKTKKIDDKIIGAYVNADFVYKTIFFSIVFLLIVVAIILICIFMIFRYHLKRYVLKEIYSIEYNLKELMDGNNDVTFETEYNTEFRYMTTILNEWKDSYKYKSERMTRIITAIDSHVAVFECLYAHNFFSDNIQSILGIDHNAWNEIIQSPKGFEKYVKSLIAQSEEEIITLKNNKSIRIVAFNEENAFYGMIMDKTEYIQLKNKMQQKLLVAQEGSELDSLTNLTNRAGLERCVKQSLENDSGKGTMLIFDLDNFKLINDQLGHPEGDKVLKKFAHCLKSYFRPGDVVARMGGDEFVVFMHANIPVEAISDKLHFVLKGIRKELSDYYNCYGLSTSIGVAYVNSRINSYDELYKCADVGLYMAKGLGKDCFYINEDRIVE